jgi:hypothetical protein
LLVVTIGSPTLSGSLASAAPPGDVGPTDNAPVVREVVEDWLRRPGRLARGQLADAGRQRLEYTDAPLAGCVAVNALGGSPGRVASARPHRATP